ncbi:MAG: hypothetical protein CMD33_03925 [Flavobacteriales bacterium]|nr:hypothetical protein [Flavobacteriales bacterium]
MNNCLWPVIKQTRNPTTKDRTFARKHTHETMSNSTPPMFSEVDITKFVYQPPKRNSNGGFNAYIDTSDTVKYSPKFQLSECLAKFGISDPMENSTRRNMEISIADPSVQEFFEALDNQNIRHASEHSKEFFKKDLTVEVLKMTLHRPTLAPHSEGIYDPLLRLKIIPTGRNKTKIYVVTGENENGLVYEEGEISDVTPRSKVVPVVKLGGMWYVSKMFGMTVICTDLIVFPGEDTSQPSFNGYTLSKKRKIDDVGGAVNGDIVAPSAPVNDFGEDEIM